MATEQPSVSCGGCGRNLAEPTNLDPARRLPCPDCGALTRTVKVQIEDSITLHDRLDVVHKGTRPGVRGRRLVEQRVGDSQSADGTWARIERVIDHIARRYRERIVAADGTVLRNVDEPLEAHQGHGSAKVPTVGSEAPNTRSDGR